MGEKAVYSEDPSPSSPTPQLSGEGSLFVSSYFAQEKTIHFRGEGGYTRTERKPELGLWVNLWALAEGEKPFLILEFLLKCCSAVSNPIVNWAAVNCSFDF